MIEDSIRNKVVQAMQPMHFSIENESYRHNVPAGSESHFKLVVVSDAFDGLSRVKRHQHIYSVLSEEMEKIHALALHLYTETEWGNQGQEAPLSPNCRGGTGK
ncbi:predicted protein [Nematostella vectensis]|uniref:Uncharacterized protein n=1 Tax=Nematostella vectensis TaxID=45351 RepID=A8DWB5_NEMVE|nr:predicted protein [Nematostella vectensis]|eukprot:XP_001617595.1 hypothetical protein NEMVEDRAFT_v1g157243 [Nematostella vectensis]